MTFRLRAFWKFWSQIVHWHVFVCASDPHLSPWNGCHHQKWPPWGLKWLPASKMASLRPSIPLLGWWPAWSPCGPRIPASPSLWLVWVGSPFKWHDTCLPLWSLQTRKWTYGTHAPDIFTQHLFLSSLTLGVIDYFDYFWPCPLPVLMAGLGNFICNLFGTPKWQAFYRSLYKIDNFGWNNQVMWSAVSVSVSIAPWGAR